MTEERYDINKPVNISPVQAFTKIEDNDLKLENKKLKNIINRREAYKTFRSAGFSKYEAAIKAGYSSEYVQRHADMLERYFEFSKELINAGINNGVLAKKLNEQLNAESIIATRNGVIKDADWVARDKALDKALKFLVPQQAEDRSDTGGVKITINLPPQVSATQPIETEKIPDNGKP